MNSIFTWATPNLPWHRASEEVHEHVAQGLDIVAPRLLDSQVRVDGRVASCACQVLVLPVGDVDVRLGVPLLILQDNIDDVDLIGPLAQPHEEVVWLDIPVDEALRVHVLDPRDLRGQTARSSGAQHACTHAI